MAGELTTRLLSIMLLLGVVTGCTSTTDRTRDLLLRQAAANAAYQESDCERAIVLYQKLVGDLTDGSVGLLRIGNCMARDQRWADAAAAYRQAVQRNPSYVEAWYNLSYVQAQVLGQTVVEMTRYTEAGDPTAARARRMAEDVLKALGISLQPSPGALPSANSAGLPGGSDDGH